MEYVLNVIGLPGGSLRRVGAPFLAFGRHVHDHFIPHPRNNYHPHILGHRALAMFSVLLVTAKIFTIAVLAWGPIAPAYSSAITETNVISLTNASREQFGETALKENSQLDSAAQTKANDMLARGYFAHNTPDGRTPWSFITAAGYNYLMAGENLAVNFTQAEDVETAWMNSPDHRANILNKDFQDIGIGISQGEYQGHTAIFVVQEFGTPAEQQVALSNQPTQVAPATSPAPAVAPAHQPTVSPPAAAVSKAAPTEVRGASASGAPAAPPLANASADASQYQTPAPASDSAAAASNNISIQSGNVELAGRTVDITADTRGPAVKVLAYFGQQAVMLMPVATGTWQGQIPAANLAQSNTTVKLEASDINGTTSQLQLADFSPSISDNYNLLATTPASYITLWGITFDPKAAENSFYLLFIACLLTSLVLAIAIKRHVQHLPLIANACFVIILATLLWWGG